MQKSDIRYPRATADLRPADGHAATEIVKCQSRGSMQREEMWPTWHNHTSLCHCPERGFSSVKRAYWPDWQEHYGYFPWQPAEPAGILERGGWSCDGSQKWHLLCCKYRGLSSTKANFCIVSFIFQNESMFKAPVLSSMVMAPYVSQGLKYPLKWFVSICPPVHLLVSRSEYFEMGSNS